MLSEWKLRGKGYCNHAEDYSCLLNYLTNEYQESCRFEADTLDKGTLLMFVDLTDSQSDMFLKQNVKQF